MLKARISIDPAHPLKSALRRLDFLNRVWRGEGENGGRQLVRSGTRRLACGAGARLRRWIALAACLPLFSYPIESAAQDSSSAGVHQGFKFDLRRVDGGVVVLLELPTGRLTQKTERAGIYELEPKQAQWHVIRPPFNPYQQLTMAQEADQKAFSDVFSVFHDQGPPNFKLLMLPQRQSVEDAAEGFALAPEDLAASCPEAGATERKAVRLLCLLHRLQKGGGAAALMPIDTPTGRAVLAFEAQGLQSRAVAAKRCDEKQREASGAKEQQEASPEGCAWIPALLIHDEKTLNALVPGGDARLRANPRGVGFNFLSPEELREVRELSEVVDFLHPTALLSKLIAGSEEAGGAASEGQDAVLYRVKSLAEAGKADAAPSPHLAREALLFYHRAYRRAASVPAEDWPANLLLRTPLSDGRAAADLVGTGALGEAFLPAADQRAQILSAPIWLYDRLTSVALSAQAETGKFCRAGGAEGRILFGASEFSQILGDRAATPVDETEAPNARRRELYGQVCAPTVAGDAAKTIRLAPKFASQNYRDICGLQEAGLKTVDQVLGKYRLSPVIHAPWRDRERKPWQSASFVLSDVVKGVYLQSRPVSAGDFAEYLTSQSGCANFTRTDFAEKLVRCDGGRLMLSPELSGSPSEMARFQYFYGAISAVWKEETDAESAGLACLNKASTEDRGLCATQLFLAARAVDRLQGLEDPPPPEAKEGRQAQQEAGPWESLSGSQGQIGAEEARRLINFTACDGPEAKMLTPDAQPLCFALQHYARAAFFQPQEASETGGVSASWREAPITMTSHRDAESYLAWRRSHEFARDPTQVRIANLCEEQIGLPTAADLAQGAASEAEVERSLLPELRRVMQEGGESVQSVYRAAVLASRHHVAIGKTQAAVSVAGLPVGFRQITIAEAPKDDQRSGALAQVPNFASGQTLAEGFGLSPHAVSRYFKEIVENGECLECVASRRAFWWSIWRSDADDPCPLSAEGGAPVGGGASCLLSAEGGDPTTGFRLMLRLQ